MLKKKTSSLYKIYPQPLLGLMLSIEQGTLGLPEIQRPFVWKSSKARDLLDSMYRGYPVGTLLFWNTGVETGMRQIGNAKETVPTTAIVDGQQRLTSLYAIMSRSPVLDKNFQRRKIRIAFSPTLERFEVTNAAIQKNPEYIDDIAKIWEDFFAAQEQFLFQLSRSLNRDLSEEEKTLYRNRINSVNELQKFSFQVIEINAHADPAVVAEIFVRTNSKGVVLNQSDFILTLMSVYWDKGRRELEAFCRQAADPRDRGPSPRNPFIDPSQTHMLRAVAGLAFRRGRLEMVHSLLGGKNLDTGEVSEEIRNKHFDMFIRAQEEVLDLTNWHEFLKCLTMAGFMYRRMLSSETTLIYSYVLWLIGMRDTDLDKKSLQVLIARWFFMAHTTRRYTSSSETRLEADLARVSEAGSEGKAFRNKLNQIIDLELTSDYWTISLPNELNTTATKSPALSAYWASLVLLDAEALFGNFRVRDLLNPTITPPRSLERHHLFPKAYLGSIGVSKKQWNAIANMSFVDWPENTSIGSKSPSEYLPSMKDLIPSNRWEKQTYHHALPRGWEQLDYHSFLEKRQRLMAKIVREGFNRIDQNNYYDRQNYNIAINERAIGDLLEAGESQTLEFKSTARYSLQAAMPDKRMEHAIVKTVCGFLNSDGGILLIGVDDEGRILGLKDDLATFSRTNLDQYELWLRQRLETDLSHSTAGVLEIEFPAISGRRVCKVSVEPAGAPVFAKPSEGNLPKNDFWVRKGNATKQLYGYQRLSYIQEHWG